MKKLLAIALGLALLPLGQARADDSLLKNFKFTGQLDLQAQEAHNAASFKSDHTDNAQTRLMLGMGWDLLDDVHAMVTLDKNDRLWGGTPGSAGPNQDLNTLQSNVYVDQAYFKVDKVGGAVDLTLGRQFYGNPGDPIIYFGPSDKPLYGMPVYALDAGRFDWTNGTVNATALFAKFAADAANGLFTAGAGSPFVPMGAAMNVNGVEVGGNLAPASLKAFVYEREFSGGVNDYLYVYGVKARAEMNGLSAGVLLAQNAGNDRLDATQAATGAYAKPTNYNGTGFLLDASYSANQVPSVALVPWFQFALGTGGYNKPGFTTIAGDFRPGAVYGYFAPIGALGLGSASGLPAASYTADLLDNRIIWGLGLKATPAALPKLTGSLSYWSYSFDSQASGVSTDIGSEFDVNLGWQHSQNVAFDLGWGDFQEGNYISKSLASHPVTMFYADARVKF